VECTGKAAFAGFDFLRQSESGAWRSRKRLPKRELQLGGSKDGGWVYTDPEAASQNGDSCAGINRHEAENARVLRERGSDLLGLEFCVRGREVSGEA